MDTPLEIRFHNLDSSEALEAIIRERVTRLERLYDRLTSCRVSVEVPHRQHRKGNQFEVHIDLGVPGGSLMVNREPHKNRERIFHPDFYTAARDAFDAAERRLLDYKARQRGEVKPHAETLLGSISQVDGGGDHGFLVTATGTTLYFHRNSVMDCPFEGLKPGDAVHYLEAAGDTGPIASRVWVANPTGYSGLPPGPSIPEGA